MLVYVGQKRRSLVLLLCIFFGILLLTFVPYGDFPPPVSLLERPGKEAFPTDPDCDPFNEQGHLHLNKSSPLSSYFVSYSPTCKPTTPLWLTQLAALTKDDEPILELKDRSILFIGDSVDRLLVIDFCNFLNGTYTIHPVNTYRGESPEARTKRPNGALPRLCRVDGPSGRQNLTLSNYFFYGFDEEDMWMDKKSTYTVPAPYTDRWQAFTAAYETLYGPGGVFNGTMAPDLVFVNMGLWELARFDRIDEQSHRNDPRGSPEPEEPLTVTKEFVDEFVHKTVDHLVRVRKLVGDKARIRWRQMHTPIISSGPYFKDANGNTQKSRARFGAVKVKILNEAAEYAVRIASEKEAMRRWRESKTGKRMWSVGRKDGKKTDDGSIGIFPVGELMAPWPAGDWLRDDIHQTNGTGLAVWMGGVLEYLVRTPR
ncbi:hypothetical protein BDZ91DRAFT_384016 [Kalaharituber pfeilii]|nr:hypothetical protein BDZ91DRAFT_384016 [Kalaharituber pfeilii]